MSKIKNSGLDQYGAEPIEPAQFGTAGIQGVKKNGTYLEETEAAAVNRQEWHQSLAECVHMNVG